jgi:hypothetical protein
MNISLAMRGLKELLSVRGRRVQANLPHNHQAAAGLKAAPRSAWVDIHLPDVQPEEGIIKCH